MANYEPQIKTVLRFNKVKGDHEDFSEFYKLAARYGHTCAVDSLLTEFPHCCLGTLTNEHQLAGEIYWYKTILAGHDDKGVIEQFNAFIANDLATHFVGPTVIVTEENAINLCLLGEYRNGHYLTTEELGRLKQELNALLDQLEIIEQPNVSLPEEAYPRYLRFIGCDIFNTGTVRDPLSEEKLRDMEKEAMDLPATQR